MGIIFCKCCCHSINSVGVLQKECLKVLLLGLTGSGKTEVGHVLSHKTRKNHDPTNGVQYYEMELPQAKILSITEIGGSEEMCKIWYHYYVTTMGVIYCFDMSANYIELNAAFNLLRHTLTHPCMRGKPVLLVGTKSNCTDEGIQLYDIENAFNLDALAQYAVSSIRLCYYAGKIEEEDLGNINIRNSTNSDQPFSLFSGVKWFVNYLLQNYEVIKKRISYDENIKIWQNRTEKILTNGDCPTSKRYKALRRKKFFRRSRTIKDFRPSTAPAVVFSITQPHNQFMHDDNAIT